MQFSAKGGIFFFFFYIPSSLIVDCHFFPSLNTMRLQSEFAAEACYCQFLAGTKGGFMASTKRAKQAPPKPGAPWDKMSNSTRGREASKPSRSLPFTFILMANLLSSVLHKMIRARCFLKSANFWILPGAHCHFDSPF